MGELGNCRVCGKDAGAVYPLLSGSPAFCSEHHNSRDAGPFGCDFSGPDDFDIPVDDFRVEFRGDRDTFVWKDKEGVVHKLTDIDDVYLANIVNFLRRRVFDMSMLQADSAAYWSEVIVFLEKEQRLRR